MIIKPEVKKKIFSGSFSPNASWDFFVSGNLPPAELCSAVFCIAKYKDKFVLTRSHRGWELLGGHIEKGETIEETLRREALEEGGITIDEFELFGYRKYTAKEKIKNNRGFVYPFPISYNPHFIAITESEPCECTAEECFERGLFTIDEIEELSIKSYPLIRASLPFFEKLK